MGKEVEDQSSIGIIWAKKPVTQEIITRGDREHHDPHPRRAADHEETATFRFDGDAKILSLLPTCTSGGRRSSAVKVDPDGKKEVLLDVPAYDFGWQTSYLLKEPLLVKKGTRIKVYARYDNSANNPANPDPKRNVRFGEQTWQECPSAYVDYVKLEEPPVKEPTPTESPT